MYEKKINNWDSISSKQKLSISFIRDYKHKLNWKNLCLNKNIALNKDFIREFKNEIDWNYISKNKDYIYKYKKLDEEFILEFKHKLNWFYLFCINKKIIFTKNFIVMNINNLNNISVENLYNYYSHIFCYYSKVRYKKQINNCFNKLIKKFKNEVIIKYIFNSLGDIGIIINSYINYEKCIHRHIRLRYWRTNYSSLYKRENAK